MKKLILLFVLTTLIVGGAMAQATIKGVVKDMDGMPVYPATIRLLKGGSQVKGTLTDFDGNYLLSNLDPGKYSLLISYVGFQTQRIDDINIIGDAAKFIDIEMSEGVVLDGVEVIGFKEELFDKGKTTSGGELTDEEVKNTGLRNVNQLASTTAGVSTDADGRLNVRGARAENTVYFIDGQRVRGNANLPPVNEFQSIQILTGGVSARFGDVIGGVVSLTSKGPSEKFSGSIDAETSYGLDNYDYLRVNASMSGPILRKKTDDPSTKGRTILGYRINAQYQGSADSDPPAVDVYRVKDDVLESLKQNPILFEGGTLIPAAQNLTDNDVEALDYQPFEDRERIDFGAKLDAYLGAGIDMTLSGQYFDRSDQFTPGDNVQTGLNSRLLNTYRNPYEDFSGYRGNIRFRQRFNENLEEGESSGLVRNVSYTLQGGYDKDIRKLYDSEHGDDLFNYGFYGNYDVSYVPTIVRNFTEDGPGDLMHVDYSTVFNGYTPGHELGINDVLSRYNPSKDQITNVNDIAIQNGQDVQNLTRVFDLHNNIGQIYNRNLHREREIYQFDANASFDIVPAGNADRSHSIQFGILYEERLERQYSIVPRRLWITMQNLANGHIGGVDTNRVVDQIIVNGEMVDIHPQTYNLGEDARFAREIRKLTGDAINESTNINALHPSQFGLDMFSGQELNNANIISYYGYDYQGNAVGRDVSFEDFFLTEDGRNNFAAAAFNPIYQAAYIEDKFSFKDLIFRVGLRIDRYDANTKVMKDPYSINSIMEADEFYANSNQERPGGIGDDYKVYVTSEGGNEVQAFRKGDTWYSADGVQQNDGNAIFGGGVVNPKYTDPDVKIQNREAFGQIINKSFEDYTPQINVLPRIAFSFPISDEANFYAHYDVLTQRPTGRNILSAVDFYYWEFNNRITDNVRNNNNLKPQKTVDYEVGFQQKVTSSSALKFSAFYKEIRDLIQWRTYLNVPQPLGSYATFDNLDFGTIKGFTFSYDLRRTRNLSLNANYTLQFADGTGSNPETQQGIADLGNIRNVFPLSFDERHRVVVVADYRYGSGKAYNGPRIAGRNILENTGLNIQGTFVSGRPYTAKQTPRRLDGGGTVGSLNGARLPGQFTVNARLDRNFTLGSGENAPSLNVFIRCQNLLDAVNILNVYPATGSAYDDGYLASPLGQAEISNLSQSDEQLANNFINSYNWRMVNPDFFAGPRRFYVGAIILF